MIVAPLLIAVIWGLFLSPRAAVSLPEWAKFAIEAVLFGSVFAGLLTVGLAVWGGIGLAVWLIDKIAILTLAE